MREINLLLLLLSSDRNVSTKQFEKLFIYKDLKFEESRMCDMRITTISLVTGELGLNIKAVN